jgi:hypothetical protein
VTVSPSRDVVQKGGNGGESKLERSIADLPAVDERVIALALFGESAFVPEEVLPLSSSFQKGRS